jgi:hypothetical protein
VRIITLYIYIYIYIYILNRSSQSRHSQSGEQCCQLLRAAQLDPSTHGPQTTSQNVRLITDSPIQHCYELRYFNIAPRLITDASTHGPQTTSQISGIAREPGRRGAETVRPRTYSPRAFFPRFPYQLPSPYAAATGHHSQSWPEDRRQGHHRRNQRSQGTLPDGVVVQ